MKPINTAERRVQFLRFVLLYLLTMLPVVVLMLLFSRNERLSYTSLLSERNELKQKTRMNEEHDELVKAVTTTARLLQQGITAQMGTLGEFEKNGAGPLMVKVQELESAVKQLEADGGSGTGLAVVEVAQDLAGSVTNLITVYESGFDLVKELNKDKKQLDKDLAEKIKELGECTRDLRTCQQFK